jgi:DNA repair ATPase RecN
MSEQKDLEISTLRELVENLQESNIRLRESNRRLRAINSMVRQHSAELMAVMQKNDADFASTEVRTFDNAIESAI